MSFHFFGQVKPSSQTPSLPSDRIVAVKICKKFDFLKTHPRIPPLPPTKILYDFMLPLVFMTFFFTDCSPGRVKWKRYVKINSSTPIGASLNYVDNQGGGGLPACQQYYRSLHGKLVTYLLICFFRIFDPHHPNCWQVYYICSYSNVDICVTPSPWLSTHFMDASS